MEQDRKIYKIFYILFIIVLQNRVLLLDLAIKLKELFKHELTVLRNYGFSASPIPQTPTEKTIRHVNKFSRTLKRRLTMRTMYEARELKKQGVNLIHVLVHMTDLVSKINEQII